MSGIPFSLPKKYIFQRNIYLPKRCISIRKGEETPTLAPMRRVHLGPPAEGVVAPRPQPVRARARYRRLRERERPHSTKHTSVSGSSRLAREIALEKSERRRRSRRRRRRGYICERASGTRRRPRINATFPHHKNEDDKLETGDTELRERLRGECRRDEGAQGPIPQEKTLFVWSPAKRRSRGTRTTRAPKDTSESIEIATRASFPPESHTLRRHSLAGQASHDTLSRDTKFRFL